MNIKPFQPKPSLKWAMTPVVNFLEKNVEPGLAKLKKESEEAAKESAKVKKKKNKFALAIKKFNKKWFVGNLATRTKVILRGYRKELNELIQTFEKRLPGTTSALKKVGGFLKGAAGMAAKAASTVWDIVGEGWLSFIIDLLTFKALQWLADKRNQDKLKNIFDGMFKLFNLLGNIGKFTITVGKLTWSGLKFIGRVANFLWNTAKWLSGWELGVWFGKQINKIKWDELGENLKNILEAFSEFVGLKPAKAVAAGIPTEKELKSLEELKTVFDKDIPKLVEKSSEEGDNDLKKGKEILEKDIKEVDIKSAEENVDEVDKTFKETGKDAQGGNAPPIPNKEMTKDEKSKKDLNIPEAEKKAIDGALKGNSKKKVKPLPKGDGIVKSDGIVKGKDKKESGSFMNKLFQLPFKAVGTAIVGMLFDSIGAIPGIGPMVKPLVEIISGNFGLSSSSLMKYLSGTAMSEGNKFGETMKLLVKFVEAVANGNIGGFFGQSGENKKGEKIKDGVDPNAKSNYTSSEVRKAIWNYFSDKISPAAAAGIVGNFAAESSFDTTAGGDNGTSFGLAQWHAGRFDALKDFAESRGTDWTDLQTQLDFTWKELNESYTGVLKALRNAETPEQAAKVFMDDYENPSDERWDVRLREANAAYNDFKGMMRGGLVKGEAKPGDHVDAMLEPGEYVLNKNAVKTFKSLFGESSLDELNYNIANRFGDTNKSIRSLKDIAMDMKPDMSYKFEKQKSKPTTNVINIPETVNNHFDSITETFGEAPLGETMDMSLIGYSTMVGSYV